MTVGVRARQWGPEWRVLDVWEGGVPSAPMPPASTHPWAVYCDGRLVVRRVPQRGEDLALCYRTERGAASMAERIRTFGGIEAYARHREETT